MISCYLSLTALFESVLFSQSRFSAFSISGKWIIGLAEVLGGTVTATGSGCERIDWICGGSSTRGFAWGGFGRFGEFSGRFLGFFGAFLLDSELIDAFLGRIFATEVGFDDFWALLKIQLVTEQLNCNLQKLSSLFFSFEPINLALNRRSNDTNWFVIFAVDSRRSIWKIKRVVIRDVVAQSRSRARLVSYPRRSLLKRKWWS